MAWLAKFFSRNTHRSKQAKVLYRKLMAQSRNPMFYGDGKFPDTYDGRLESLTNHIAVTFTAMNEVDTSKSSPIRQAVFDEMVRDFDVALREEGMTDEGLKHRMRPMIGYFYARLKKVSENLRDKNALKIVIAEGALNDCSEEFSEAQVLYVQTFFEVLRKRNFEELAGSEFEFPEILN